MASRFNRVSEVASPLVWRSMGMRYSDVPSLLADTSLGGTDVVVQAMRCRLVTQTKVHLCTHLKKVTSWDARVVDIGMGLVMLADCTERTEN